MVPADPKESVGTEISRYADIKETILFARALYHSTVMGDLRLKPIDVGTSTSLYCAVVPGMAKGRCYSYNELMAKQVHVLAENKEAADELWEKSLLLLVGLT